MAFTKTEVQCGKEDSPECFDFADDQLSELSHLPIDHENRHNIWFFYYDFCEAFTDFDEFQFDDED